MKGTGNLREKVTRVNSGRTVDEVRARRSRVNTERTRVQTVPEPEISCNNIVSARYRLYNVCTDGMDIDNLAYVHAYAMHGHAHVLTAAIGILPI